MFQNPSCLRHCYQYLIGRASSRIVNLRYRWFDLSAQAFFQAMSGRRLDPEAHIDVLPRHQLIYVSVPKCASTAIKSALGALELGVARRHSGLRSPTQAGLSTFRRLANSAATLWFAFVRNPYARLAAAWADMFQNKPWCQGTLSSTSTCATGPTSIRVCRKTPTRRCHLHNSWPLGSAPPIAASTRTGSRKTISSTCPASSSTSSVKSNLPYPSPTRIGAPLDCRQRLRHSPPRPGSCTP